MSFLKYIEKDILKQIKNNKRRYEMLVNKWYLLNKNDNKIIS